MSVDLKLILLNKLNKGKLYEPNEKLVLSWYTLVDLDIHFTFHLKIVIFIYIRLLVNGLMVKWLIMQQIFILSDLLFF